MKAVLFDLDDTLYDQVQPFRDAYEEIFGERFDIKIEDLYSARQHRSDEVYHKAVSGEMTMKEMYIYRSSKPFEDLGYQITDEEALQFQYAYAEKQKELRASELMKELLRELKERQIPIGIISNGPAEHQRKKIRGMKLQELIPEEAIFVSGDDGISKPEKWIFDRARNAFGLEAKDMIYVGDSWWNDIRGAKGAGWIAVWFNRRKNKVTDTEFSADYEVRTETDLRELLLEMV